MQRFGAISPRRGMLKGTARSSTLFECPLLVLFYGSKFGDVIYFCFVGFFFCTKRFLFISSKLTAFESNGCLFL